MKYDYWYSLDGNRPTPRLWGLDIPETEDPGLPNTLFEIHGLELERWHVDQPQQDLPQAVIQNLVQHPGSTVLIMAASEYTRAYESSYEHTYRKWVKRHRIRPNQITVIVCSDSLRDRGKRLFPDLTWGVYDYWEHQPRLWFEEWHCAGDLPEPDRRFTCLNRRPHEMRAALYTDLMTVRAYRHTAYHTMGNRNYHNFDTAEMDLEVIRSGGNDPINYLDSDIERSAAEFYRNPQTHEAPGEPISFQDRSLFDISAQGCLNIITESYPNQRQHSPTEKTYRAYAVARPHITFAHCHWESANLQPRGYHSYPWDTDVDACRDPAKRYRLCRDRILRWAQMSKEDFQQEMAYPLHIAQLNHAHWLHKTSDEYIHNRLPESLRP